MERKYIEVSIIIPCADAPKKLKEVIEALLDGQVAPLEIVIVAASKNGRDAIEKIVKEISRSQGQQLFTIVNSAGSYPGRARNDGVGAAKHTWIGFIDVSTLPTQDWLKSATEIIHSDQRYLAVIGAFVLPLAKPSLLGDAIFGRAQRPSLPGTVVSKDCFYAVGLFDEMARGGEDQDWLLRLRIFARGKVAHSKFPLKYTGLEEQSLSGQLKKWFNYYSKHNPAYALKVQKKIALTSIILLCVLTIVDDQVQTNYTAHVIGLIVVFYFCYRILFRLKNTKVPILRNPYRTIKIIAIVIILDSVKIFGLTFESLQNRWRKILKK